MEIMEFRLRCIRWACWSFFALCAVAIGRWGILRFVCWADWGTPDWAAWVQAIGSIAAICGAIWIADRERAHRARDALTVAVLAATENQAQLQILTKNIAMIRARILNATMVEPAPDEWMSMLHDLRGRVRIDSETLLKFSALPDKCALRMARANADLHIAETLLTTVIGMNDDRQQDMRIARLSLLVDVLGKALNDMGRSMHSIGLTIGDADI
ncbi:hypothetical protein GTP91_14005 [Rugamonas sp. FT82W]|uniref:Uncharacterized protein n=1 Tax=Duganella vulcania TaxID=2692166 RepID=A0A845G5Z1_9BURK|nr:hypothetical protein [Duganella vulcania]MYM88289.1 hypothetical protein [Duganella vulcania]